MNPHTPKGTPTLGVGVPVDFQMFREWLQRSKLIGLSLLYIMGNFLECRCLKWACMTHLNIWNISCGQKKSWESNWQFNSRPLKVGNWPDFLACRWRATYLGKLSTRATTLLQTSSQSEVFRKSYGPPKSRESQVWEFRDSHLGVPEQKAI
jgi:hypothetical protein